MKNFTLISIITLLFIVFNLSISAPSNIDSTPISSLPITSTLTAQTTATSTPSFNSWPGLNDGWMNFSIDSDGIFPIYDPAGYFWANGDTGLLRWKIDTGELNTIPYPEGLPFYGWKIVAFNEKIWLIDPSNGDVFYYSNNKWMRGASIPYKLGTATDTYTYKLRYTLSEAGGRLWLIGVYNDYTNCPPNTRTNSCTLWYKGFYHFDGKSWKAINPMPDEYLNTSGFTVARSKDGSFWFWDYSRVLRFNGEDWREYKNLRGSRMFALADGTLLFVFGTMIISFDGDNLSPLVFPGNKYYYSIDRSYLTPAGDLFVKLKDYYNQPSSQENSAFLIHNGHVEITSDVKFENSPNDNLYLDYPTTTPRGWIFRSPNGFFLYDGKNWKQFEKPNTSLIYQAIGGSQIGFAPDGSLWSVDNKGIKRFDGRNSEYVYKGNLCFPNLSVDEILYNPVNSFVHYRMDAIGNIWGMAAGANLLCYLDAATRKTSVFEVAFNVGGSALFPSPFSPAAVNGFALAPDGSVWTMSAEGYIANFTLDFLRKGSYQVVDMIKIGGDLVHYLLNPLRIEVGADGVVWVFAENSGLYGYDGSEWKYLGLSNLQNISSFAIDRQGQVWAGYSGMLIKFEGAKWVKYPIQTDFEFTASPSGIVVGLDNSIWFSTFYNRYVINNNPICQFKENSWSCFKKGFSDASLYNQILFAPDGAVWFTSYNEWARYKP